MLHDKGKQLSIVNPLAQALRIENYLPQIALFSKQFASM
jgi:hypothetical protein